MTNLKELNEKKKDVIEDMLASIIYTPNREQDILVFMELYMKADWERRPTILDNLRRCMDGEDYPNPHTVNEQYSTQEVALCEQALDDYLISLISTQGNPNVASECIHTVLEKLNALNDRCGGQLIDDGEKNTCAILFSAA